MGSPWRVFPRKTSTHKNKRQVPKVKPFGTIGEVSDELGERILPILQEFWPAKTTGRHHANWRKALNGILFRLRRGCQGEKLPRLFGPKSTVHDWFQRWCAGGIRKRIGAELVHDGDELGGVDGEWQSADGMLGTARLGGKKGGENPHGSRQKGHQEQRAG